MMGFSNTDRLATTTLLDHTLTLKLYQQVVIVKCTCVQCICAQCIGLVTSIIDIEYVHVCLVHTSSLSVRYIQYLSIWVHTYTCLILSSQIVLPIFLYYQRLYHSLHLHLFRSQPSNSQILYGCTDSNTHLVD